MIPRLVQKIHRAKYKKLPIRFDFVKPLWLCEIYA